MSFFRNLNSSGYDIEGKCFAKLAVFSISFFMCLFIHAESVDKSMYMCKWGEIGDFLNRG